MDDLRERLKRLQQAYVARRGSGSQAGDAAERSPGPKAVSIREQLERMEQRRSGGLAARALGSQRARPVRLEEVLRGREVTTPLGTCFEVKAVYRETYRHGDHPIQAFRHADMTDLNIFCGGGQSAGIRVEDCLFMDLETTGLSLGTGTYAFLIGLGYFHGGQYHIHQLFLRNFDEEPAVVWHAKKLMRPFRNLVTFNGKSFDIPLLEARFTMCSQDETLREMACWDLLYPSRRLWYDRLEDCRLETIERGRLGVRRESLDIPGDQIPQVYFRYIHDGDASEMERIAYHNAMDVLTLTALAIHIDRSLKEKDPRRSNLLSVGKYYQRKGIREIGTEYLEAASRPGSTPGERDRALFHLAGQRKREGRIDEAVRIWQELVERDGYGCLACCVEMAKYLEQRVKQYDEAIETVLHALRRVGPDEVRIKRDLEKRLDRLRRKKAKT